MRGIASRPFRWPIIVALGGVAACASSAGDSAGPGAITLDDTLARYETDASFRRAALEQSLVSRENTYARLRLAKYDDEHWGALPELAPETTPLTLANAKAAHPIAGSAAEAGDPWTSLPLDADLRTLGEYAFYNYPTQVATTLPVAVASDDHAGMWLHEGRTGAVWARMPSGRTVPAFTCATCHVSLDGTGARVPGRNNADLDLGRLSGDGTRGPAWRRGTNDVTSDDVEDPVAIADLRPLRWQTNLHHAATLRNDPAALAVRIETLIITSLGESVRPPRRVVAGLVTYLLSLSANRPAPAPNAVFARECARCHRSEAAAGDALLLDQVGTDPLPGESVERGTGMYRVPSLRFVGDRRRLLATGAIADLDDLLGDRPERRAKGHTFGLGLPPEEKATLRAYLQTL